MENLISKIQQHEIIRKITGLKRKGKIFLVGGTIRDILLGTEPDDFDFAVYGSGILFSRRVAKALNGSFVLLSKEDDEARVVIDGINYDFIGFKNIVDDLSRRDFTINAMALDLDSFEFLDPFKGLQDIKHRTIRLTSESVLKDDPLRILRAFRFALELDFKIEKDFFRKASTVSLKKIAAERIGYEFMRIIACANSEKYIKKMNELGIFLQIFPEARKIIEDGILWEHSLNTYFTLEKLMVTGFFKEELSPEFNTYFSIERRKPLLKLAGLFHDVAKPDTFLLKEGNVHFYGHDTKGAKIVEILGYKRLKLSRNDVATIKKLVKEHMRPHLLATDDTLTDRAIRRFFRDLGEDYFGAMMLAWADGYATAGRTRHLQEKFLKMISLKRTDDAKPKVERLVNGYDLIALGLQPGPIFKIILQEILDMQIEGEIKTKEEGLKLAMEIYKKHSKKQQDGA